MNAMTPIQTKILELWHQQLTTPQIGERLGMEEHLVTYQIRQLRARGVALPSRARVSPGNGWTSERVAVLKQMWADSRSCSAIGAHLGISRNAVIGKVHRLGLSGRNDPSFKVTRPRRVARHRPSAPPAIVRAKMPMAEPDVALAPDPAPVPPPPTPGKKAGKLVSLMMLSEKTCRWPIGDPKDKGFGFCGLKPRASRPYCEYHTRLAYAPYRLSAAGANQ